MCKWIDELEGRGCDFGEPCIDTVSIRKDILKCRVGKIVAYNVEWLKKHWQMEMDIVCGVKPCDDVISREAVEKIINKYIDGSFEWGAMLVEIKRVPSVTPSRQVIENIKADIEAARYGLINDGLDVALRIIDKHIEGIE